MQRLRLLTLSFVLFLVALPLVSAGTSGGAPFLLWGGLLVLVIASGLTLSVRFLHGDTCEQRVET
jgi:hypothetical protein